MMERPWWQKALYEIWPKIYRIINNAIFFILMVLRSLVKGAIKQIKRGY